MSAVIMSSLQIRRPEFVPSEIPIITIPFLLTTNHYTKLFQWQVLEGVLLFFLYFNFGDMISCLADRDLDAKYKTRLFKQQGKMVSVWLTFMAWASFACALTVLLQPQ